jgi:N-acetylglucosamine-6-sulfatase
VSRELPSFDEDTSDKPDWVRREPLAPGLVDDLRTDFRNRIRMVQSVDDMVGRVLAKLTPAERNETFIVFASDNGFHLGQHRLVRGKATAYDHDVRVTLLVKRPGRVGNGDFVRNEIVQNVDLFATFLDMAGCQPRGPGRAEFPRPDPQPGPAELAQRGVDRPWSATTGVP